MLKKCVVEKKYKNGNVIVNGYQFRQSGWSTGDGYNTPSIYKDNAEVYEERVKPIHLFNMKENISKYLKDATYEDMQAIYSILKKEKNEEN